MFDEFFWQDSALKTSGALLCEANTLFAKGCAVLIACRVSPLQKAGRQLTECRKIQEEHANQRACDALRFVSLVH